MTAAAFWSYVEKTDGCWNWTGSLHKISGYGQVGWNYRNLLAHRVAWELAYGPIPGRLRVCHTCDNKRCCKPAHLFLGTDLDNIRDAAAKGRMTSGERNNQTKLTVSQVHEIKRQIAAGASNRGLARDLGLCHKTIAMIRRGITWRNVA